MQYIKEIERNDTSTRYGVLRITDETYRLPACSPTPRTRTEGRALMKLVSDGLKLEVISPHISRYREMNEEIGVLLGTMSPVQEVSFRSPLVIPDIESEAINFNCFARSKLFRWDAQSDNYEAEDAIFDVANSNLSGVNDTHSAWRRMIRQFGTLPLLNWQSKLLASIGSDVLFVPTPIIRGKDEQSVRMAIDVARSMIPHAKLDQKFTMQGVHFLLHGDVLGDSSSAVEVRNKLIDEVRSWRTSDTMSNLFISFKVHDSGGILTNSLYGGAARRHLSELTMELHEATEAAGGLLVAHNWGNWALGLLDSGADVVSYRIDGKRDIETVYNRKVGTRTTHEPPRFMVPRALIDFSYTVLKEQYEQSGGFPCSNLIKPQPYWDSPRRIDQLQYTSEERLGVLFELGEEFRNAGLDPEISISEAVRSRVLDSQIIQELKDLCPSF